MPDPDQKTLNQELADFCRDQSGFVGALMVPALVETVWHDPFVFLASTAFGYLYPQNDQKRYAQRLEHIDKQPLDAVPGGNILASGPRPEMPSPVDRVANWLERHADITAYASGMIIGRAFDNPGMGLAVGSLALQIYKISPLGRKHSIEAQATYHENLAAAELEKGTEIPNLASWHERRATIEMERAAKVRQHKIEAYYPY